MERTLTVPQILAYRRFWKKNPPTDRLAGLIARFLGYRFEDDEDPGDGASLFDALSAANPEAGG